MKELLPGVSALIMILVGACATPYILGTTTVGGSLIVSLVFTAGAGTVLRRPILDFVGWVIEVEL